MTTTLLIGQLFLIAVFTVAAATKLADRRSFRSTVSALGVSQLLSGPVTVLLPLAELITAAALLFGSTARWGAVAALALLTSFIVIIAISLARGRRPECHCFGQFRAKPVGWVTVARNVGLATIAVAVAVSDPRSPSLLLSRVTTLQPFEVGAGIALFILACLWAGVFWVLLNLTRQQGRLLLRIDALEGAATVPISRQQTAVIGRLVGSPAPEFTLPAVDGGTITLTALLRDGLPVLLVFTQPDCGACVGLLPDIATWQHTYGQQVTVAVISGGRRAAVRDKTTEHNLRHVLIQDGDDVADTYGCRGTPSAVLVDAMGLISAPLASGSAEIRILMSRTLSVARFPAADMGPVPARASVHSIAHRHPAAFPRIARGFPAPFFTLPDLTGQSRSLDDFRNVDTVVLFFNPACSYCQELLGGLHKWELSRDDGGDGPDLLLVSTGSVSANQQLRLASPVLLDDSATVMQQFGAVGTPMATRVDSAGNVSSELVAGAAAVMSLLEHRPSASQPTINGSARPWNGSQ